MTPYYRIIRPVWQDNFFSDHLLDNNYCGERQHLVHALHIILNDFKKLFDYVELHDSNKPTFSHRIYELLLRTCTEFENNCKGILKANGYAKTENWNIKDYFKLNQASRLNEYELIIDVWSPHPLIFKPFEEWNTNTFTPLTWYQGYNSAKHDRTVNFHLASLDNLVKAIGALYIIVSSQFYWHAFNQYQPTYSVDNTNGFKSAEGSIMAIKFPSTWTTADFIQQNSTLPYRQYDFNS